MSTVYAIRILFAPKMLTDRRYYCDLGCNPLSRNVSVM